MRGTAPGFAVEENGTHVFALPGPPHEMQRMFERDVSPRLAAMLKRRPLRVETFRTFGVGESQLMEMFGAILEGLKAWEVSSLPWVTGVDIILTERREAGDADLDREAGRVERALRDGLGTKLYEHGERSLAAVVGDALTRRRETLAVAESLTGGMISTALTDIPGSSAYLLADLVVYGNASKSEFAGVDPAAIAAEGAVSETVCRQMAEGARRRAGATWALSTTGIAGPDGATDEKPLGLTWLGLAGDGGCEVKRRVFAGERGMVRGKAAFGALWMLYDRLMRKDD
jgi:nicotinamide-nucleotide amidase